MCSLSWGLQPAPTEDCRQYWYEKQPAFRVLTGPGGTHTGCLGREPHIAGGRHRVAADPEQSIQCNIHAPRSGQKPPGTVQGSFQSSGK